MDTITLEELFCYVCDPLKFRSDDSNYEVTIFDKTYRVVWHRVFSCSTRKIFIDQHEITFIMDDSIRVMILNGDSQESTIIRHDDYPEELKIPLRKFIGISCVKHFFILSFLQYDYINRSVVFHTLSNSRQCYNECWNLRKFRFLGIPFRELRLLLMR